MLSAAKSLQSCLILCDPVDGSPPGCPVPGILQVRTLEWVAISFPNAWKWKVKVKSLSPVRLLATSWTAAYQASLSMGFSRQEYWSRGAIAFSDTVLSSWPQTENNLSNKQKGISHSDIYLHYRSLSSYKSDSYKDYVEIWNNYDIILNREIVSIYWMFTMSLSFCYSIYIHYLFLCSQNLISR